MRAITLLLLAIWVLLLSSCNVMKHLDKQNEKAFRSNGMKDHIFTDRNGPHYTWSSTSLGANAKPKLLLVHGITSSNAMWAGNLATFRKDFDLIVPDLIGHGRSTDKWSGNSVDEQVAHLILILDSLHVNEPVYVVGNSYGGAIAANLAEQHPERVRALVIYDGPVSDYTAAMADSVARSVGAKDITDLFTPKNEDEQYRLLSMAFYQAPKIPRFALKQMNERMEEQRGKHLALLQDLLKNGSLYAQKRYAWSMPVFVLWGEGDRLIPVSTGRGIVHRNELPADHFIIIPKAGHAANLEQPASFEEQVLRMLKDGPCPDPARISDGACTLEYRPVCGCDGKTYPNPCGAMRAGVRIVALGECR